MIAWLLAAVSLALAFGTAILAPGLWRAWTQREPESLPPAPQRTTQPPALGGITMAEAARALQARPEIACDVVLVSRAMGLKTRLRCEGRYAEADVLIDAMKNRS